MQVHPKKRKVTHHQKGFREYLLCQKCETYLSKSEDYVRRFLYGGTGYYVRQEGPISFLSGLNYHHIRICFLSILWRMSVSTLPVFKAVDLGPHEEHIRRMLHEDDAGEPHEYGFWAVVPIIEKTFFADWILEPDWTRFENHRLYRAVVGGILYCFVVSDELWPTPHPHLLIQKDGRWMFQHRDIRQIAFLRQWINEASKFS